MILHTQTLPLSYSVNQATFQDIPMIALRTLTLQQQFDYCLQHLAMQVYGSFTFCRGYRVAHHHAEGRKSAVGYFVAPIDYTRKMEGFHVTSPVFAPWRTKQELAAPGMRYERPTGNLSHDKLYLLVALENLHDALRPSKDIAFDEKWSHLYDDHLMYNAELIAEEYGLILDSELELTEYDVPEITD